VRFKTADDVIDRILSGAGLTGDEEVRALQCLSLFETLTFETHGIAELDFVAVELGRMSGDAMFEHLAKAQRYDLVGRNKHLIQAQPLPIVLNLAMRRLALVRPSLLLRFVRQASDELVLKFLHRLRHLGNSPTVIEMANGMLQDDKHLGSVASVLTRRGAAMLAALVHIVPDSLPAYIWQFALVTDPAELVRDAEVRRLLVKVASRLVFRSASFRIAARLLLHMASAEPKGTSGGAFDHFRGLFQLHLSGTEVPPAERFEMLDEGLKDKRAEVRAVCVEALGAVFTAHFSRASEADEIGSMLRVEDWKPQVWGDVYDFYHEGLTRLAKIREIAPELGERAERILARASRTMLNTDMYEEYGELLRSLATDRDGWPDAVKGSVTGSISIAVKSTVERSPSSKNSIRTFPHRAHRPGNPVHQLLAG
jgi:hypothetical protein